jgi:pimeloyl-ACP methyl ester carboxylesterase
MRTMTGGPISDVLRAPIAIETVDFAALTPVDDAAYSVLEAQLRYSPTGLDPRVEQLASANPAWTRERISLASGYDESRFNMQLFLPTGGHPPYQTILFFPHAGYFQDSQSSDAFEPSETNQPLDFILKSGRAFVVIAFDGSFERRWPKSRRNSMTRPDRYRLLQRHHRQDLGRALDYLATREDLDSDRLGVLAISYGAQAMMPLLALEKRLGATVLIGGGVFLLDLPPSEQPFNYLPRVTQPILMLSGRWDIDVSPDAQDAMLRLLGTPADDKLRILFDAGHGTLPQNQFVRATLDWYDQHLGSTQ